jgi:hypothetical protein
MARFPIHVRQRNADTQQQLKRLHDQLPDLAWPVDEGGEILIVHSDRYEEEAVRGIVERVIRDDALTNLSLEPFDGS